MTSRGRGYSSTNDWDTMRDNSTYDSQYADEDSSANVQYDDTRLYITNLPKGLNEQGLKEAFSRFGTLEEAHLSKDPKKRYALVKYETSGEARVAMMKMNKTEPLCLNVSIAHKNKTKSSSAAERPSMNGFNERSRREESASVSSKSRNLRPLDEPTNGDDEAKEKIVDDMGVEIDRNLHMELEALKLEELKIKNEQLKIKEQELACKQRILLLQQNETKRPVSNQNSGNRCVLPDGRILVRNSEKFQDNDAAFIAGAGDSLNIPGLQRVTVRSCIVCGAGTEFHCSGCGVVSYCTERCQRRDWADRHKDVCHNLQRLSGFKPKKTSEIEPVVPPAAPLRIPNAKRDQEDSGSDRTKPKNQGDRNPSSPRNNNNRTNNNDKKPFNNNNKSNRTFTPNKDMRRPQINKNENDEEWDNAASPKPTPKTPDAIKPVSIKPEPVKPEKLMPEVVNPQSIKPVEPAQSVQHRLTAFAVKQNVPAVATEPPVEQVKKLMPANYVIEKLPMGETFLLSIECTAAQCASKQPGFVCLTLHTDFEEAYGKLCQDYAVQCEENKETITPTPNSLVSYLSPSDGGWYRARCLTPTKAALLDASRVTSIEGATCKTVSKEYADIPEFCAVINGPGLKVGMNLKCTLKSKIANGFKVSVVEAESNTDLGEAEIERWMPEVEMSPSAPATPATPLIPTVPRPDLHNSSKVVLLDAKSLSQACIMSATSEARLKFDSILHDVLLYAMKASPLKEPPQKGSVVISMFEDGVQYRALVKRTNVKANKYLVEYIEYGNEEIVPLEKLYPCPTHLDLSSEPTLASIIQLSDKPDPLTPPALALINNLKDNNAELILTLPSGEETAPSGALVQLHLAKNRENITKKLEDMCTPEWKKMEERGGDVLETKSLMFNDFPTAKLPTDRPFVLEVVDFSSIKTGCLCGYVQGEPLAEVIYGELTEKINKYAESELCKEPYLPKPEELCITQCPPYPQWFRAVLFEQVDGAGGQEARVLYVDYGNIETVPVSLLRKMLPEFVEGYPGLANLCEIKDFPKEMTDKQLQQVFEVLNLNDEGHGMLKVKRCRVIDSTMYEIEVPDLIAALKAA